MPFFKKLRKKISGWRRSKKLKKTDSTHTTRLRKELKKAFKNPKFRRWYNGWIVHDLSRELSETYIGGKTVDEKINNLIAHIRGFTMNLQTKGKITEQELRHFAQISYLKSALKSKPIKAMLEEGIKQAKEQRAEKQAELEAEEIAEEIMQKHAIEIESKEGQRKMDAAMRKAEASSEFKKFRGSLLDLLERQPGNTLEKRIINLKIEISSKTLEKRKKTPTTTIKTAEEKIALISKKTDYLNKLLNDKEKLAEIKKCFKMQ